MATTIPIPLTTLAAGPHDFGPAAIADNLASATLTVDRTVAGGFNATPAAQASIQVMQSGDGGATFRMVGAGGVEGGSVTNPRTGSPFTASSIVIQLFPGAGRQVKATIVVSGSSVAVSGSLAIS